MTEQRFKVVRDDLLPGGTKSRFVDALFDGVDEVVYSSPRCGGGQTALALAAKRLGKRLSLFVPAAGELHPRVALSMSLGANVVPVQAGRDSYRESEAKKYVLAESAKGRVVKYVETGFDDAEAIGAIAAAARKINPPPSELWCAAGSGTIAQGLALAWPDVTVHAVVVGGKKLTRKSLPANINEKPCDLKFSEADTRPVPFPADPHYEAKAWHAMLDHYAGKVVPPRVTFWNTAGPAELVDETAHGEVGKSAGVTDKEWDALQKCIASLDAVEVTDEHYRDPANPTRGKCMWAAQALYTALGGKVAEYKYVRAKNEDGTHFWVKTPTGQILDPTAEQFEIMGREPPYSIGKATGFREPSAESKTILVRMMKRPA